MTSLCMPLQLMIARCRVGTTLSAAHEMGGMETKERGGAEGGGGGVDDVRAHYLGGVIAPDGRVNLPVGGMC
jgi:hypothetical protein